MTAQEKLNLEISTTGKRGKEAPVLGRGKQNPVSGEKRGEESQCQGRGQA